MATACAASAAAVMRAHVCLVQRASQHLISPSLLCSRPSSSSLTATTTQAHLQQQQQQQQRAFSSSSSAGDSDTPWHLQDQIVLRGLVFHGYHGALPEENVLGQKFVVDATLWADLAAAGRSDNLQDTIDYSKAYSVIQRVVEGKPRVLQEAVAEDMCQQLMQLDQRVSAVQVYIRKPHVALSGVLDSVGVQVLRRRPL